MSSCGGRRLRTGWATTVSSMIWDVSSLELIAEPFLAVREDFHPKRNQARQKLATLPKNRFKDLASDVFHELRRRYPDFDEEEVSRDLNRKPNR